jgi:hypothetical protein
MSSASVATLTASVATLTPTVFAPCPPGSQEPMSNQSYVHERGLERQGRRIGSSGGRFLLVGALTALPGIIMLLIGLATGHTWLWAFGIAVILIGSVPGVIGVGMLVAGGVARWHARHRLFA